ncbi:hypothetical protein Enr13x_12240 [Stieleria neptunia]|uniref:Uncharacterized protein n=1 Tax=Stieleria neptunia TaxID=2527979 RepID=A0A518HKL1_9BACT|nr:WD40 repeat domain-containing protein [Stieleria neptunia]QDV41386.1 hypothetical protein Enr13x_12240 [Stieleria neptunia]
MRFQRLWTSWKQVIDFFALWGLLLGGVLVLAGAEAVVIWGTGFRYQPVTETRSVWFEDLSFNRSTGMAAVVVRSKLNAQTEGIKSDIVLVNLKTHEAISLDAHHLQPLTVALSPDASTIAVVGADGAVRLMTGVTPMADAKMMAEIKTIDGATFHDPIQLRFSPDGEKLAAINDDHVWVWSLSENRLLHQHQHYRSREVGTQKALAFSADSRRIISGNVDGGISIRDLQSGNILKRIASNERSIFDAEYFEPGRLLVVMNNGAPHEISLYPVDSGPGNADARRWTCKASAPIVAIGERGDWAAIASHRHGKHLIGVLDLQRGTEQCVLPGHTAPIMGLATSGTTLYSWDSSGTIIEWDMAAKTRTRSFSMLEWMLNPVENVSAIQ